MTVDECIDKVIAMCASAIILPSPNPREVDTSRNDIRAALHALILTESKRAAAFLESEADKFKKARLLDESSLLRTCAEQLLATSPGKGGA